MSVIASMIVKIGADIADLKRSMEKVSESLDSAGIGFGKLVTANITAEAAMKAFSVTLQAFGGFLSGAVNESAKFNNAMIGLSSVAAAFGVKADVAKDAARSLSSDGLMTVGESASGLKNLLASGFSLPEATRLMLAFKDSAAFARQGSLGFGEAIIGATEGIKNGNSALVDNAGVTKNLSVILTEAGFSASDLGKASSDARIRLAILNGVIKEAAVFSGDAARLSQTYTGAIGKLDTQWRFLQATVGDAVTQNATVSTGIDFLSGLVSQFTTGLTDNGKAFDLVSTVVITFIKVLSFLLQALDYVQLGFNGLLKIYADVIYGTNALGKAVGDVFLAVLERMIKVLPDSVSNFLHLKDGINSLKTDLADTSKTMESYADMSNNAVKRSEEWGNAIQGLKKQFDDAIPRLEATRGKTVQLGDAQKEGVKHTDAATDKLKGFAKTVDELNTALVSAAHNNVLPLALEEYKTKIVDVTNHAKIMGIEIPKAITNAYDAVKKQELDKIVKKGLDEMSKEFEKATKHNTDSLLKLQDDYAKATNQLSKDSLAARLDEIHREMDEKRRALDKNGANYAQGLAVIDLLEKQTAKNATDAWDEHVREAQKQIPTIGKVFTETLKGIPGLIQAALTGGGGLVGGIQAMGSKLGAGLIENLFTSATGLGQKLATGLVGSLGSKIGGAIAGLMGPLGSAIGSLIGPLMGKVVGLFKKPEYKKLMSDVGKDWGVNISEGLAKQIADFEKTHNVSRDLAEQLNLSKILSEAGGLTDRNISKFQGQALGLFNVIKSGSKESGTALTELNSYFGELTKRLEAGGGIADKYFLDFIHNADAAGVSIQGMSDFVLKQSEDATKGLQAFVDNATVTTQTAATSLGAAVAALFYEFQKGGLTASEALAKLSPIIEGLEAQFKKSGLAGGEAFDQIQAMAALASDKIAGPAITAINGLGQAMIGLHNTGIMNAEMFSGLAGQVAETFNGLVNQGYDGNAAMGLIQPTLQTIWQLQKDFGYAVDEGTQKLLDQAEAAGIVGDKHRDAMDRVATATERIADILAKAFGVDVPNAMDNAAKHAAGVADAVNKIPTSRDVDINYHSHGSAGDPSVPDVPQFANGGIVTKPTLAMVGEGGESEAIIPLSKLGGIGGGGSYEINITFDRPLMRDAAEREHVINMVDEAIARRIKANKRLSVS